MNNILYGVVFREYPHKPSTTISVSLTEERANEIKELLTFHISKSVRNMQEWREDLPQIHEWTDDDFDYIHKKEDAYINVFSRTMDESILAPILPLAIRLLFCDESFSIEVCEISLI